MLKLVWSSSEHTTLRACRHPTSTKLILTVSFFADEKTESLGREMVGTRALVFFTNSRMPCIFPHLCLLIFYFYLPNSKEGSKAIYGKTQALLTQIPRERYCGPVDLA